MKQKNSNDLEALCEQLDRATESLRDLRNLIKETNGEYRDLHTYALEKRTLHEQEEMYAFIEALSEGLRIFDKREENKIKGIVYSAIPLDHETIQRMEIQTSDLIKKDCVLTNRIDEKIIGGFIISIDDKLIDASIRKRMEDMRLHLSYNTNSN